MNKKLSLIISFYNKPEYLELIFASLERQSFQEFEVIIADDGSREDIVAKVKQMIASASFSVQHIWHEDKGWRKTTILNRAVVASSSDYLVFIDGDCIPHKKFLEEHYRNKKPNIVLVGRRVNLPESISTVLNQNKIANGFLEKTMLFLKLLFNKVRGHGSHPENGIYIGSPFLRNFLNRKEKGVLGSNFSIYKSDLLLINGFDERYIYPAWGEDTDIEYRLRLLGITTKPLKYIAIQYHMYHKTLVRRLENQAIFDETIANKISYTPFGIKNNSTGTIN